MVEIHYPSTEMVCSSKISCISWSSFHKSMLASSDYEVSVPWLDQEEWEKRVIDWSWEKKKKLPIDWWRKGQKGDRLRWKKDWLIGGESDRNRMKTRERGKRCYFVDWEKKLLIDLRKNWMIDRFGERKNVGLIDCDNKMGDWVSGDIKIID